MWIRVLPLQLCPATITRDDPSPSTNYRLWSNAGGTIWESSWCGATTIRLATWRPKASFTTCLGLSYHTVNSYVDFLEGAFLVRRLQPWFSNIKKRLVRTPKCYWRDSGLLHGLWGIEDADDLLVHPSVGASWEGFVIEQILSALTTAGQQVEPWYFRTSDGQEIDLLLRIGKRLWAIEVKLTAHPTSQDLAALNRHADLVSADRRALLSQTAKSVIGQNEMSCSLHDFLRILLF